MTPISFAGPFISMLTEPNAVQIRVSLDDIAPEVWRRLIVPLQWNLEQFHLVIQAAFNWWNYHLHEFRIGGLRYGDIALLEEGSVEGDSRAFDQREVRFRDFEGPGTAFAYIYDFGDNWRHTVEIEKLLALDASPKQASCIDGARARPPEDVGGIPGYEQFLAVIADPKDPEHAETKSWCGGHFDPEWFDLATANKDVRNALKPNVRRRLHQPKPKRPKSSS
ncbi:plasmid pRiA4b ORF-3 family protein [Acidibrevibacterium fodinaquatile]|uniref:plasmid pRiA4b ORF-3 family protein n=1 Tax=Acidibrevibacterium fodinaquatile TaxID=1969806 RepID=UPI0038D173B3